MISFIYNRFGCSSPCSPSSFCKSCDHHFSPATTSTAIALLAILILQLPLSLLFSSSYVGQDDFLVFCLFIYFTTRNNNIPISPPALLAQQSFQFPNLANATVPSVDNFCLPDGYIIEPIMWNLTMPTSIAVDSSNGTIYVANLLLMDMIRLMILIIIIVVVATAYHFLLLLSPLYLSHSSIHK